MILLLQQGSGILLSSISNNAANAAMLRVVAPVFHPDAAEARRRQQAWQADGVRLFVAGTDKIIFADAVQRCGPAPRHGLALNTKGGQTARPRTRPKPGAYFWFWRK